MGAQCDLWSLWPDDRRRDLCAVEDAECADSMRREHPDDGERVREALVQRVPQSYDNMDNILIYSNVSKSLQGLVQFLLKLILVASKSMSHFM